MITGDGVQVTDKEFDDLDDSGPGVVEVNGQLMPEAEVYKQLHPDTESEVESEETLEERAREFDDNYSDEDDESQVFPFNLPDLD